MTGIRIKHGRFTSGGLKTQQKAIAACCSFVCFETHYNICQYCIYIIHHKCQGAIGKLISDWRGNQSKTNFWLEIVFAISVTMLPGRSNKCSGSAGVITPDLSPYYAHYMFSIGRFGTRGGYIWTQTPVSYNICFFCFFFFLKKIFFGKFTRKYYYIVGWI